MQPPESRVPLTDVATLAAALSDGTRLRILALLRDGEVCVCHIHEALGIAQPTASRHLAALRRAGLVDTRREGLWVHYRLTRALPAPLQHAMDAMLHAVHHTDDAATDARALARATGRVVPVGAASLRGCCAPPPRPSTRPAAGRRSG